MKHALCSASGSERWLNCPGSLKLEFKITKKSEPSVYAEEGTRAHAHAEKLNRLWLERGEIDDAMLEEVAAGILPDDQKKYMLKHVYTFAKYCQQEAKAFEKWAGMVEEKLILNEDLVMFGTADFCLTGIRDGIPTGVILDLKYGTGKMVVAENNPQLAYYACALRKQSSLELERVKVRIIQPRSPDFSSEVWYSREDLDAWEEKLISGADRALNIAQGDEESVLVAGPWCQFCRARGSCPERKKDVAK
jgi:predicted RecB family nuclease